MPYFTNFPRTEYIFGSEDFKVLFPNLTAYSNILDEVKLNGAFYQKYYIKDGLRPDHVSQELYGTPDYHWTFYLLNNRIREQGWPLDYQNLEAKINENFPNTVIVTRNEIYNKFSVGETVTGLVSEETGTIIKRNLDLGQIFISGIKTFEAGEVLSSSGGETITVQSYSNERAAAIFYRDGSEIVDIDPFSGPGESLTKVSYADYLNEQNLALREIIVLKPAAVSKVAADFKKVMRQ